jgi:hypothetical protein
LEPPIPPNLTDLNAPLKSFVDFMRIDTDLISVAAENSTSEGRQTVPEGLKTWIHNLPVSEKDDILFRLVEAPQPHLGAELMQRFQQKVSTKAISKMGKQLRSVKDLISRTETYAEERRRRVAVQKAREHAREKSARTLAREKYLESLAGRENSIWKKVDEFIDSKQPAKYDQAVKMLVDLRDLNKKTGKEKAFNKKLKTICENHHRKMTFLNRLKKVGIGG